MWFLLFSPIYLDCNLYKIKSTRFNHLSLIQIKSCQKVQPRQGKKLRFKQRFNTVYWERKMQTSCITGCAKQTVKKTYFQKPHK